MPPKANPKKRKHESNSETDEASNSSEDEKSDDSDDNIKYHTKFDSKSLIHDMADYIKSGSDYQFICSRCIKYTDQNNIKKGKFDERDLIYFENLKKHIESKGHQKNIPNTEAAIKNNSKILDSFKEKRKSGNSLNKDQINTEYLKFVAFLAKE